MRVDRSPEQVTKLHQQELRAVEQQESSKDRGEGIRRADQVTLSSQAQEIRQLLQALAAIPPERVERVAALRRAIADGHYAIPVDALAERLVGVVYA